jgi:hypothetical protein
MKKQEKNEPAPKKPYTVRDYLIDIRKVFADNPAWQRITPLREGNSTSDGNPVKRYEVKIFFNNPNREEKRNT